MPPALTRQQRKILEAVHFFLSRREIPTVREVGALVGLRSPATVLKHLRALEKESWISLSGKSRGIRLLRPIPPESSPDGGFSAERGPFPDAAPFLDAGSPSASRSSLRSSGDPERSAWRRRGIRGGGIRVSGAIAAGRPFESYSEGFAPYSDGISGDGDFWAGGGGGISLSSGLELPIDPRMFVESGEVFALRVEGDSMINAGILDGDYVIIRRQDTVEEGDIAAVIINGEGTLKRWHSRSAAGTMQHVRLEPANERFDPIEITEDDAKEVMVFGKYVGLVRGNLREF